METTQKFEHLGTFEQKRQLMGRNADELWEVSDGGLGIFLCSMKKTGCQGHPEIHSLKIQL